MNIHYLQHVPFEGPGSIESWAITHGHSLTSTRLYAGDPLPALTHFDMLIILGGPMSIHDEFEHVWLKAEKWFIRQVIDAEKPVLGICLGAQLIAEVLGAEVYAAKQKEIGWYPLSLDKTFATSALGKNLPQSPEVLHWHGETFTLPDGAARIASTPLCENQGFIYDNNIIALQFHLEATYGGVESLIENSRHEMTGSGNIQTEVEILSDPLRFSEANRMMEIFLTNLENLAG